jgi:uncharacterized protein
MTPAPEIELVSRLLAGAGAGSADVDLALVFGSVARGSARPDSDLDLAADGPFDLLELSARLSEQLGREVHVVRLRDATIPLLEEIIAEGIVVHEGRPGRAATWRSHTLADFELDLPWYRRQRDAWLKRLAERGL